MVRKVENGDLPGFEVEEEKNVKVKGGKGKLTTRVAHLLSILSPTCSFDALKAQHVRSRAHWISKKLHHESMTQREARKSSRDKSPGPTYHIDESETTITHPTAKNCLIVSTRDSARART